MVKHFKVSAVTCMQESRNYDGDGISYTVSMRLYAYENMIKYGTMPCEFTSQWEKNLGSHHTTSRWYGASSILQILSTESSKVLVPATSIVLGRFVSIVGSIAELVGCSHTAVCCWLFIFHHHSNSNTNNKVRLPQGI